MQEYERAVLEKYDIDVIGTRKTRGAILCETNLGLLLLKEVKGSEKRIPVLCGVYDFLQRQGYEKVDHILKTKEGECAARMEDGGVYVLKRWFQGRECDVRKPAELRPGCTPGRQYAPSLCHFDPDTSDHVAPGSEFLGQPLSPWKYCPHGIRKKLRTRRLYGRGLISAAF